MNENLMNTTLHRISLLFEAWQRGEISTADYTEQRLELQTQLYAASEIRPQHPRTQSLVEQTNPCRGCRYYHGKTYGGNRLICGMHPSGVEGECPDREEGEQYRRELKVQRDEWLRLRGVWSSATNYESPSETYEINPYQRLTRSRTFKLVNGRRVLESEEIRPSTEEELQEIRDRVPAIDNPTRISVTFRDVSGGTFEWRGTTEDDSTTIYSFVETDD